MKKNSFLQTVLVLGFILISNFVFAQVKIKNQQWEVGLLGGVSQYNGDLNSFGTKENNLALGMMARYHVTDNFAVRGNFIAGHLTGNDANSTVNAARKISFRAGLRELAFLGEYDLLGKKRYTEGFRKMLSPYFFGGVALANITPNTLYFNGVNDSKKLKEDIDAPRKKLNITFPIGAGLKFDLAEKWTLNVEAGYRILFSDYVDGVSKLGNPSNNDSYAYAGVAIGYRIPVVADADGDGVNDSEDLCPMQKGNKRTKGCPDTDGDGISDNQDKCPKEKGTAATKGCPDADEDGVADADDKCPSERGTIETNGCPDADADGVADADDKCPKDKGTAATNGCPDTDKDGVIDSEDTCPNERGVAENKGCPDVDTDKDAVVDRLDKCPNIRGDVGNAGCPKDADGDGVIDSEDACPMAMGSAKTKGCPDRDGDGVEDGKDQCPDLAGVAAMKGCPAVTETDQKTLENATYGVQFESGNDKLKSSSFVILDNIVDILRRNALYQVEIEGHTDNIGDDNSNQRLSENRAAACYRYLTSKGVDASRITYIGLGETQAVADNDTTEGRAKNRRVEFTLSVK